MRYLIDAEYRQRRSDTKPPVSAGFATALRQELGERNLQWAPEKGFAHEATMGSVPAVLYREDERGRHGNFLEASYRAMCGNSAWKYRLRKAHSSAKRRLLSHDPERSELDSSNSSDALLMNIFCHPETLRTREVRELLNVSADAEPVFGYKPRIVLMSTHVDCTEVDLKLGDLLVEAKLTEYDFQQAPRRLIDRYARFEQVFDLRPSTRVRNRVESALPRGWANLNRQSGPNQNARISTPARPDGALAQGHAFGGSIRSTLPPSITHVPGTCFGGNARSQGVSSKKVRHRAS